MILKIVLEQMTDAAHLTYANYHSTFLKSFVTATLRVFFSWDHKIWSKKSFSSLISCQKDFFIYTLYVNEYVIRSDCKFLLLTFLFLHEPNSKGWEIVKQLLPTLKTDS